MHLSSFADKSIKTRYVNFGKALLWALDHADRLLRSVGTGPLELMNAVRSIFHLVESVCFREWQIDQASLHNAHGSIIPSPEDAVYDPTLNVSSGSVGYPLDVRDVSPSVSNVKHIHSNLNHTYPTTFPCPSLNAVHVNKQPVSVHRPQADFVRDHVAQTCSFPDILQITNPEKSPRPSDYIRKNGRQIMPVAYMKETPAGCHVPFELSVPNDRDDNILRVFDLFVCSLCVLYPDNTCLPYIPVQSIRVFNESKRDGLKDGSDPNATVSVEMSSVVYETLLNQLKQVYITKFGAHSMLFHTDYDVQHSIHDKRVKAKIPLVIGSFARVVDLLWFVEHPLWETLKKYQQDVVGCGLIKVEFVETIEGTRIDLALAGVIVERSNSNYCERIFELLDNGSVAEL